MGGCFDEPKGSESDEYESASLKPSGEEPWELLCGRYERVGDLPREVSNIRKLRFRLKYNEAAITLTTNYVQVRTGGDLWTSWISTHNWLHPSMRGKLSTTHIGLGRHSGLGDIQSTCGSHDSETDEIKLQLWKAESYHESFVNPRCPEVSRVSASRSRANTEADGDGHRRSVVSRQEIDIGATRSRCLSLQEYKVFHDPKRRRRIRLVMRDSAGGC